ncbi:MAG: glycosyltransferase family 4 protein [Chitinophagaceae bacterium]|nr:glycosyltransferase family 4 protein [Chitinophagaceae bacterium]MCW5926335.1 glycosyltransferase family 4 protein [Chitinophagaceae bacterium]
MKILVYCEPLYVPTTGTPMRNMLRELIQLRKNDTFILVVRSESNEVLLQFFKELEQLPNWRLSVANASRKLSNLLGLFRYKHYCRVNERADVYLNTDGNSLGGHAHPLIITVADVSSFHNINQTSYKRNWQLWLRRFILTNGINEAEKVISISDTTKEQIVEIFPGAAAKTETIYNGIHPLWISQEATGGHSYPYWIWWGFISPRKNMLGLLEAYRLLKEERNEVPKIKIIYSNEDVPQQYQDFVQENGLAGNVQFEKSKPLSDLINEVSSSSGLLFPSFIEGFGMPVVEALSRGIPVLTSDTKSLKEVSGNMGIYVDPSNSVSIKEGLERMLAADISADVKEEWKNWARQFSPEKAAICYSSVLDSICSS